MQFKYAQAQSLFLGDVMLKNDVMYVIIKGFTADNAYSNCIVMRKIYNGYDPSIHMEGHEGTHLFHWSTNMDKITKKKHIKPSFKHQHKQLCKEYNDAMIWRVSKSNIM